MRPALLAICLLLAGLLAPTAAEAANSGSISVTQNCQVATNPLALGQTEQAIGSLRNTGRRRVTLTMAALALRDPNGADRGDFQVRNSVSLDPGQTLNFSGSRVFPTGDPIGQWRCYVTWLIGSTWSWDAQTYITVAPAPIPTPVPTPPPGGGMPDPVGPGGLWTPVFDDEFSGASLDTTKWGTGLAWGSYNASDGSISGYDAAHTTLDGAGSLVLKAEKVHLAGTPPAWTWTSGAVHSDSKVVAVNAPSSGLVQTYGFFEIRAKLPKNVGMWPQFVLYDADIIWPPEIDIFEGDGTDSISMHVHGNDSLGPGSGYTFGTAVDTNWHTYGVWWQRTAIRWYMDGNLAWTFNPTPGTQFADPPKTMYMNIAMAINGATIGASTGPYFMYVDYARVWNEAVATQALTDSRTRFRTSAFQAAQPGIVTYGSSGS